MLYLDSGVRSTERGAASTGRDPATGLDRFPPLELARLTVPRRTYTQSHMDLVADSLIHVLRQRDPITRGLRFVHEPDTLRFFQARFAPVSDAPFLE
ncbi:beta-eliminating lyase-related protein [Actinomadura sp. KC216]|uniref:beta-eliminating lyase-related protein n=1 Tax=Actinomadura sp. KC216 TaxID=2530370 RepID=UPI001A9E5EBD|nr:beta-eliminating lyase-related protein [Actinomadura sp. KC216]